MNRGRAGRLINRVARPMRRAASRAHPVVLAERLELDSRADLRIREITAVVKRVLPRGAVRNTLHGVPLGHPAHAPLTDLPIGAYSSAVLLDFLPGTQRASKALIFAGLAASAPTAVTGWADWSALHREQQRVGLAHAATQGAASVLFGASLLARVRGRTATGKILSLAGLGTLAAGAYLGGHLAFRMAAGANHAPSAAHLVPLGWHDLCALDELPDGWPVHRALGYIDLFVLRQGDRVHVLADACAHLAGPLHQGRITAVDGQTCVMCPWHGSVFRVTDGSVVDGPATARQTAFDTRVEEDGRVQVRPI
ncbi:Rieske 2Fe-2S domain-containing protein [Actinocorallia herbida]|nr:Rieske 2Fe-2S domain-containing protein [Actinocorallia herbida]